MVIKELYLENFGKFSDKHFYIEEGIHVFYGENEYGKSTVYAFIKAMLFGMERGRGRAAQNDGFSRYEPWVNPNYYAGSMRFSIAGKNFFLERKFDRYTKSAGLVCEDDGEELSVDDGDLDMLLGKMTAESFENTAAVGQLSAKPGQGLAEELKNYAANYYETGSSTVDLGGALETLRRRRKAAEQEIRSLGEMQETKKDTIRQECQYVSEDAGKLQRELEENQKILKSLLDENAEDYEGRGHLRKEHLPADSLETISFTEDEAENHEADQYKNLIAVGGLGIAAGGLGRLWSVLAGSGEVFAGGGAISVLSWIFLAAGLLLLGTGAVKYGKYRMQSSKRRNAGQRVVTRQEYTENDYEKKRQIEENRQKLEWENQRIKAQWKEKQVRFQNLQEQLAELEMPDKRIKNLQNWGAALLLAEEKMIQASRNMTQGFGNILNQKASKILEQITGGRYTKLLADENLNLTLFEGGRRIPVERVSRGTIEQVYFALRMAAVDMLYEEPLPVIFDDAFACYDEKRLKSTLKWLSEQQRQVIIFTCQKREQEIVKQF
ncbi:MULTISPECIES: ATP-binding protein [Clostridia]|uniref:ATP-binding protein n=1 Tax=Clostridia TaxID=186801 RepID=UPI00067F6E19|nr:MULTISPECIES: AAA family ATPase [Clostridia]